MKLQYLGDYRDAFKWDLLHWLCTDAATPFRQLLFVPLLTPDDPVPTDGQIHHRQFAAREFIHAFVEDLRVAPRSLERVRHLGAQPGQLNFAVTVHGPGRHVPSGKARSEYWRDLTLRDFENTLVFCDPDNGFETRTQRGPKWMRHQELGDLLAGLPRSSAVIVYQHRPRRTWEDIFAELGDSFADYAPYACTAYDHTLAFVALARNADTFTALKRALIGYAAQHPKVEFAEIPCTRPDRSLASDSSSLPIVIRRATLADVSDLAELNRTVQALHAAQRPDHFRESDAETIAGWFADTLSSAEARAWIAEADGKPVAYLLATIKNRAEGPFTRARQFVEVDQIAVLPAHRRQGVARRLVDAVAEDAKIRHLGELELSSWQFNAEAHAAFRALGFEEQLTRFRRPGS
ncbi:MAG: GNAT family N-acetyltransferase [Gemmatimonadaceae bacterium]